MSAPADRDDDDADDAGAAAPSVPEVLNVFPKKFQIDLQLNTTYELEIKLENITNSVVAFKVKTTAPRRYMVRPTHDILQPGETKICRVVFAKIKEYPDVTKPRELRDKFLVQSIVMDGPLPDDQMAMWKDKEVHHAPKSGHWEYFEHRIRCKLVVPAADRAAVASQRGAMQAAQIAQTTDVNTPPTHTHTSSVSSSSSTTVPGEPSRVQSSPLPPLDPSSGQQLPQTTQTSSSASSSSISSSPTPADQLPVPKKVAAAGKMGQSSVLVAENKNLDLSSEEKRKAHDYDALIEFTVKLTAESERLKQELQTAVDKYKRLAESNEATRRELRQAQKALAEAETKSSTTSSSSSSSSNNSGSGSAGSGESDLRNRKAGARVTIQGDVGSSSKDEFKGLKLEYWQAVLLILVVFFIGYFLS